MARSENVKRPHYGKNNSGRPPLQVLKDYAESLADAGDEAPLASNLSTVFGAEGDLHRQLLLRLPETFGVPLLDLAPTVLSKATGLRFTRQTELERPARLSPSACNAINALHDEAKKPVYLGGEAQESAK